MSACPVCSESADAEECSSCGTDLTPLSRTRRTAYRLAEDAHRLGRCRQLERAADRAERGMQLYLDDRLRNLFGWLLFLDGRISKARRCWSEEIPVEAQSVLRSYNESLELAEQGNWAQALETLDAVSLPFRPVWLLRFVCTARLDMPKKQEEVREFIEDCFPGAVLEEPEPRSDTQFAPVGDRAEGAASHRRSLAAGTAVALLIGIGAGFLFRGALSDEVAVSDSVERSPSTVSPEPEAQISSEEDEPADSLVVGWAFVQGDDGRVAAALEGAAGPDPIGPVQSIPTSVREQTARDWYLEGLELFETGRRQEAIVPLEAALASVGSASDLYWVDDALYLVMQSQREADSDDASEWAQRLLEHQETSMYVNSVTRATAAQAREELP